MKPKRLWPVATAMVMLLIGALVVEILAERRGAATEVIYISSSNVDTKDDVDESNWKFRDPINSTHARARKLALRKQYDESILEFQKIVKSDTKDKGLIAEYGHWLRRAKRYDEAMRVLQELIDSGTHSASSYLDIAILYRRKRENEKADAAFRKAVQNRPSHAPTRIAYAKLLHEMKKIDEAIEMLKKASRFGSNEERARALSMLGRYYMEGGQTQKGRKVLNEAIERAPAMASIWTRVSRAYMKSSEIEDHRRAVEHAVKATRLAPNENYVFALLGRAHEKNLQRDAAQIAYENALRLDASDDDSKERLAKIYLDAENYDDARKLARNLLKTDKKRKFLFLFGKIELRSGRYLSALEQFNEIIAADPNSAEAWFNKGLVLRKSKRLSEAIAAYQKAVLLKENYSAAWNNLGLVYQQKKDFSEAEKAFKRALSQRPNYNSARRNLARLYNAQKDYKAAAAMYKKLVDSKPDDQKSRMRYAINLRKSGENTKAISQYQKVIDHDPRYISAWYNLGVAFNHENDFTRAEDAYRKALALDPNHRKSIKNIGYLKKKNGDPKSAISFFKEALDRNPNDASLRADLASAYFAINDFKTCKIEAQHAIDQSNDKEKTAFYVDLLTKCQSKMEKP